MGLSMKEEILKRGSKHYKQGGIQPIEYILSNDLDFCSGNVVKYMTRWRYSDNPQDDLKKAKHYIDFLLGTLEKSTYDNTGF
jgi:hypothetical protein